MARPRRHDPRARRGRRSVMTENAAPPSRTGEKVMAGLSRLLTRVFFRRIEVAGAEHLPDRGPVILVANHVNGLVDGLVLMAALVRYPAVPREVDAVQDPAPGPVPAPGRRGARVPGQRRRRHRPQRRGVRHRPRPAGRRRHGGHLPGRGEPRRRLPPPAAHRARPGSRLGADVGSGCRVVPVGLIYEEKARFRSRALVRIGAPFAVDGDRHDRRRPSGR